MYTIISFISLFIFLVQNELVVGFIPRIADGSNAAQGEFPFQVSFQKKSKNNRHFCGGTIVHEKFILTAAHCVNSLDKSDVRVVAGVTDLKKPLEPENIRSITDVFVHPQYHRPLPKQNDIALVKVNTPFIFNKNIMKATLAASTYQIPDDQKVYVTGWGLEKASGKSPTDKLKKAKVKVFGHKQCEDKYKGKLKVTDTVFCTINVKLIGLQGVCNGDSGGPAVINKNTLVGVINGSFHGSPQHNIKPECGSKNHPDMHSEVSKYRNWIDTTIANNS